MEQTSKQINTTKNVNIFTWWKQQLTIKVVETIKAKEDNSLTVSLVLRPTWNTASVKQCSGNQTWNFLNFCSLLYILWMLQSYRGHQNIHSELLQQFINATHSNSCKNHNKRCGQRKIWKCRKQKLNKQTNGTTQLSFVGAHLCRKMFLLSLLNNKLFSKFQYHFFYHPLGYVAQCWCI